MLSRLVFAAAIAVGLSVPLYAQNVNSNLRRLQQQGRQQQQQQQQQQKFNQPTEIQGTLEGAMQGRLVVLAADNRPWQVGIPANAKEQVTGTASPECLQNGLLVELKAKIDDRGAIEDKVGELSIVSLSQERRVGLFPSEENAEQPGFGDEVGDKPAKSAKAAKRTKGSAGKNAIHAGTYRIVGKLSVGHNGKLAVLAGRSPLSFELAEQPTITIDTSNYSIASKGDKITVKGLVGPNNRGVLMAQATEVKIELAEPLTGPQKKTASKSSSKRSSKHAKANEGLPEPSDDK